MYEKNFIAIIHMEGMLGCFLHWDCSSAPKILMQGKVVHDIVIWLVNLTSYSNLPDITSVFAAMSHHKQSHYQQVDN